MPLSLAAETEEPAALAAHWDTWFGMKSQYVPYWNAPARFRSAERDAGEDAASE
jgi:hypothetical protein